MNVYSNAPFSYDFIVFFAKHFFKEIKLICEPAILNQSIFDFY